MLAREGLAVAADMDPVPPVLRLNLQANLGIALSFQEKWTEAERVNREGLEQGRFEEAEVLHRKALAIADETLDRSHPHVASTMFSLARTLVAQDRLEEAGPLYEQALATRRAAFGDDHPEVASTLRDVGRLRLRQDRVEEAREGLAEALRIYERTLGDEHPETRTTRAELDAL